MNEARLDGAVSEAFRFLRAAEKAKKRLSGNNMAYMFGSPETAACRRASMDLTRALAELRKPGGGKPMGDYEVECDDCSWAGMEAEMGQVEGGFLDVCPECGSLDVSDIEEDEEGDEAVLV